MTKLLVTGASNATYNYVSGAGHFGNIVKAAMGFSTLTNTAVSGETHQYFLDNIGSLILSHNPKLCLFLMPANEMAEMTLAGNTVEQIRDAIVSALSGIVTACKGNAIPLAIISPPVGKVAREALRWPLILDAVKALCFDRGVLYIPFWERMARKSNVISQTVYDTLVKPDPDEYHIDVAGHALLAETALTHVLLLPIELPAGQCWNANQQSTNIVYSNNFTTIKQASGQTGGTAIGKNAATGKVCFELTFTTPVATASGLIGFTKGGFSLINSLSATRSTDFWYDAEGRLNTNGSPAEASGKPTWSGTGNTVMALLDSATGKIWFKGPSGASLSGATDTDMTNGVNPDFNGGAGTYHPIASLMSGAANGNVLTANFAGPFTHSVPSGFGPFA